MLRRSVYVGLLTAVMLAGFAVLASGKASLPGEPRLIQDKPSQEVQVKIDNFSFTPATVNIAVGTTVTWTNQDDIPHNVVSTDDPKTFKSKVLDTDDKFSFTFTKAGSYDYFCAIHPKMTGKVVVK